MNLIYLFISKILKFLRKCYHYENKKNLKLILKIKVLTWVEIQIFFLKILRE